jgi:hypothetical protein
MTPIGHAIDLRQSSGTAPAGYVIEDGTCYTRTALPSLFAAIGTTYNAGAPSACSGSQFAVPFSNGTVFAAIDTQGSNTANRLTAGGSGCTATTVATLCGSQNETLTLGQLPSGITSNNPSQAISVVSTVAGIPQNATIAAAFGTGGGNAYIPGVLSNVSSTGSNNISVTSNNTSNQPHPNVQPTMLGWRAIKI